MKLSIYFFLLTALTFSMANGKAQTDTVKNEIDEKYDGSFKEYIKKNVSETKKIWKINFVDMYIPVLSLGIETKIGKVFSTESSVKLRIPYRSGFYSPFIEWSVNHSFKYYYNLNRKERLGRRTSGFNANYFSLDLFAGENRDPKPGYDNKILKDAESWFGMALRYGMQKRFGIFNIEPYIGLSYQYYVLDEVSNNIPAFTFNMPGNPQRWHLQPLAGLNAGIAMESLIGQKGLFNANIYLSKDSLKASSLVFKTNLVDLGLLKPNIGCEWRIIGNLTSETFLKVGFDIMPHQFTGEKGFGSDYSMEMDIDQQIRYYHNLKRRALHEKNTGGFSGNYLSLDLFAGKSYLNYDLDIESVNHSGRRNLDLYRYGLGLKYGIQRRFGSIGYFDLFTGAVMQVYEEPDEVIDHNFTISKTTNKKFLPVIGLRAGLLIGTGSKRDHSRNNLTESGGPVRVVSSLTNEQ